MAEMKEAMSWNRRNILIIVTVQTPHNINVSFLTFSAEIVLTASEVFCHLAVIFSVYKRNSNIESVYSYSQIEIDIR